MFVRFLPLLFLLFVGGAFADEASEKAAQSASDSWIAVVDAAKYGDSWEQASEMFKGAVTKDKWIEQVGSVRGQLGKVKSRKLKSSHYTEELPNAPAGKYVVLEYNSDYDAGKGIDTVILMQEKDNSWKVAGYFVKPAE